MLPHGRLHLEAANLSPRTIRAYTDDGAMFAAFLAASRMPTVPANTRREHVVAFIAAELERTAPHPQPRATARHSNSSTGSARRPDHRFPMAKMRPPKIPEQPAPVLPDYDVKRLLASCSGKDFRDRRDCAIIRQFLDTSIRLEGTAGLQYNADDAELSDVDLRSRVVRIVAKGRHEMVLPIGAKSARDIDRYPIRYYIDQRGAMIARKQDCRSLTPPLFGLLARAGMPVYGAPRPV